MERNTIIAAPQVENIQSIYDIWVQTHFGSKKSFYRFMTTPSQGREAFINTLGSKALHKFNKGVAEIILKDNQ